MIKWINLWSTSLGLTISDSMACLLAKRYLLYININRFQIEIQRILFEIGLYRLDILENPFYLCLSNPKTHYTPIASPSSSRKIMLFYSFVGCIVMVSDIGSWKFADINNIRIPSSGLGSIPATSAAVFGSAEVLSSFIMGKVNTSLML